MNVNTRIKHTEKKLGKNNWPSNEQQNVEKK